MAADKLTQRNGQRSCSLSGGQEGDSPNSKIAKKVVKLLKPSLHGTIEKPISQGIQQLKQGLLDQFKWLMEAVHRISALEDKQTFSLRVFLDLKRKIQKWGTAVKQQIKASMVSVYSILRGEGIYQVPKG